MAIQLFSRLLRAGRNTVPDEWRRRPIGKHERRLTVVIGKYGTEFVENMLAIDIERDIFDGHSDVYSRHRNKIPALASQSAQYSFGESDFYCFQSPERILMYLDGFGSELKKDIFTLEIKKALAEANSSVVAELTEVPLQRFIEIYGEKSQNKLYELDLASIIPDDLTRSRKLAAIIEHEFEEVINDLLTTRQCVVRDGDQKRFIYIPNLPPDLAKAKVSTILKELLKRVHSDLKALKRPDRKKDTSASRRMRHGQPDALRRDQQSPHPIPTSLHASNRDVRTDVFDSHQRSATPATETFDERERRRWDNALKEMSETKGSHAERLAALNWDRAIHYAPMWSVKRDLVMTFYCQPLEEEDDAPLGVRTVRGIANDDLPALAHALTQAERVACGGIAALIVVPIHRLTLQIEPYNTEVVRRCQAASDKAKRHLIFELVGFEPEFPQSHFADIVRQFRALGRAVLQRVESDFKDLAVCHVLGIQGVSVDALNGPIDEARHMHQIDRVANAAKRAQLQIYAVGLPSLSLTLSAMASGCDVLGGEAVAPVTGIPSGAKSFDMRALFPFL